MIIEINRTGKKIILEQQVNRKYVIADNLLNEYGYFKTNVVNYDNHRNIEWDGIEFNRLFKKDGIIYRFNRWLGKEYPWDAIEIEEIGREITQ